MKSRIAIVAALLVSLGVVATPAQAIPLPAYFANFDDLDVGNQKADPLTTILMTPDLSDQGGSPAKIIGSLLGTVWQNDGIYTYVFEVTPQVSLGFKEFNTGFDVQSGFDLTTMKAGYSVEQAGLAGISFNMGFDSDGTLDWERSSGLWGMGKTITFFFQSSLAPENGELYNVLGWGGGSSGSATNYAPVASVPEPGTLILLGAGLVGAAGLRLFRRKR